MTHRRPRPAPCKANQGTEVVGNVSYESLWDGMVKEVFRASEVRPTGKGWKTYYEVRAKMPDIPEKKLRAALRKCEIFKGYVTKNNKLVNQVWYRPNARE